MILGLKYNHIRIHHLWFNCQSLGSVIYF